jgi:tetratricopeptide (TPR) repeat protein
MMRYWPSNIWRGRWILVALFGLGICFLLWRGLTSSSPKVNENTSVADSLPIPPFSESHFLNLEPDAHYIGSAACASCHPGNHSSYLLTPHSRTLSDVNPEVEPPDGSFKHKLSGRSYRVYRKDGQLHHEEVVRTESGEVIARVDLPVRYLVGSGHFTRTYVADVDGFLYESPITWYSSKQKWDMSPGYDIPQHFGFVRPIKIECLNCHAGRVQEKDGAVHRLTFHEKAIGCENCHGPGSLHESLRRSKQLAPGEDDLTIVYPTKLSRPLLESICAECHQDNTASVSIRGRKTGDFRPSRPLTDYRVFYQFAGGKDRMTVVGHIDQLRQSKCYQKSEGLTCVTCHDPHRREELKDTKAFYREKCLACHTSQPCKLGHSERLKKEGDNCVACHMPRGDTDIPHIAFVHHRIGLHYASLPLPFEAEKLPELEAVEENQNLTPLDRQRNLGLAYTDISRNPVYARFETAYRERARVLLEAAYRAGIRDGETTSALAEIYGKLNDLEHSSHYAREALETQNASPNSRSVALFQLAAYERGKQDYPSAIAHLEEAVKLRRSADNWRLLAVNYLDSNQIQKAIPAFNTALEIRPYRHNTHLGLADAYRRLGDIPRADQYLRQAKWLLDHKQD